MLTFKQFITEEKITQAQLDKLEAYLDDIFKRAAFMRHISFSRLDKIRNKVMPAFQLDIDL